MASQKRKKGPHSNKEVRDYIGPPIKAMVPTDIVRIPAGKFDVKYLAKRISAYAHDTFGSGNYITKTIKDENEIEIMRIL